MQDLLIGLKRAFYLFDLEPEVKEVENPQRFPAELHSVRFDNVRFGYMLPEICYKLMLAPVHLLLSTAFIPVRSLPFAL